MTDFGQRVKPAPQIMFPESRTNRFHQQDYAREHLLTARRNGYLFHPHSPETVEQGLRSMCCPPLPLADDSQVAKALDGLDAARRRNLQARRDKALASWRGWLPLISGEILREDRLTFLASPWQNYPVHNMVYHRETNLGEIVAMIPGSIVDFEAQDVVYEDMPGDEVQYYSQAGGGGGLDTVELCLNTASMIAFAFGPTGAIVGSAGLVLNTILQICFPSSHTSSMPKMVDDLISQDLANDHIKTALADVMSYATWIKQFGDEALAHKFTDAQSKAYKDTLDQIKQYVNNAMDPGSALQQRISELKNGDYPSTPEFSVAALPAYTFAASIDLTLTLTSILLSSDNTTFNNPHTRFLVEKCKDHREHIDNTKSNALHLINDRLNRLGMPQETYYSIATGSYSSNYPIRYIADEKAAEFPRQPTCEIRGAFHPQNMVWYQDCHTRSRGCFRSSEFYGCSDGVAERKNYVERVRSGYNFSSERLANYDELTHKLAENEKKYGQVAPS